MSNDFMAGAIPIEDVDFSDIEQIMPTNHLLSEVKKEIGEIIPDDTKSLAIDISQIEKILNISSSSTAQQIAKKNIALPLELYEDIKLLSKYEEINSSKFILNAIKNHIANRQFILDKIYEIKNAHLEAISKKNEEQIKEFI